MHAFVQLLLDMVHVQNWGGGGGGGGKQCLLGVA